MGRIDRYVTATFLRVFLIALISLAGMYVVGDFVGHLTEFLEQTEGTDELLPVMLAYYGARVPWLFDIVGRVLALVAAAFTVTWLNRHNEMTALMAAGIRRARVLRPLLIGSLAISLAAAAGRELVLPRLRDQLCRDARDLDRSKPRPVQPLRDRQTDILFGGRSTTADTKEIQQPNLRLPTYLGTFGNRLLAERAQYVAADPRHPAGYRLFQVREPKRIDLIDSAWDEGRAVILTPKDTPWLKEDECFVATEIPFEQLQAGLNWKQYASTYELVRGLNDPSLEYGADVRLTIHARLLQPALDMLLILLGLPSVLSRNSRNVFVAVGHCLLMVALYFVVVTLCHTLGLNLLLAPSMAAWLPVLLFVPLTLLLGEPLRH